MTQTLTLPSLNPIPADISDHLRRLLQTPAEPALAGWLLELVQNSGHLSTPDDLRWRLLSLVWLAQFDVEQAWPYLMWLNMNQPVIQDHLNEILVEAANEFDCYVLLANWLANSCDKRLVTFFSEFRPAPPAPKLPALFNRLLAQPAAPETGVWLAAFCRDTAIDPPPHLRRWHLLAAAWYAACFNPAAGLAYLQATSHGAASLSPADNRALNNTAEEINGVAALTQWIAACPEPAVKTMLKDFGHPDLAAFTVALLENPADYRPLSQSAGQAEADAAAFKRNLALLTAANPSLDEANILDLACGLLAPQTVLFSSAGYPTIGVDLHIPPAYLPLPGLKFWLKRRRQQQAWRSATAAYYETLAQQAGVKIKWRNVKIELADLTRLHFGEHSFDVILCSNYLQHAPDVDSLLAEAARLLRPGGLLLADVRPFPALTGAFQTPDSAPPWEHLRRSFYDPTLPLNRWRESQYRTVFEKYFTIKQWLTEQDETAPTYLTPEIEAELADYRAEELTRGQIVILAQRSNR